MYKVLRSGLSVLFVASMFASSVATRVSSALGAEPSFFTIFARAAILSYALLQLGVRQSRKAFEEGRIEVSKTS
jgi:hypothetical protein